MRTILFFIFLVPIWIFAQGPTMSIKSQTDLAYIKDNSRKILSENFEREYELPISNIHGEWYVSFIGKVKSDVIPNYPGVIIGEGKGKIRSVRIKLLELDIIPQLTVLEYLEIAGKIKPDLDRVNFDTGADSVHRGLTLPRAYTGKDVIIGLNDWGFDYTNPMFYDTLLQQSRIIGVWDQFKKSGPNPQDYPYGTEYSTTADILTAETDTTNQLNHSTHGTHTAGIAGGSGAGVISTGMAFEAQYLFTTITLDEASAIDSWYWMYDKATLLNKHLVVSMSWGLYRFGTPDGTSLLSQAIEELTDLGVLFVCSAGNNGNVNFHIEKTFANDEIQTKVDFYDYALQDNMWGQSVHAWGEMGHNFEIKLEIRNPYGVIFATTPYFSTQIDDYMVDTIVINGGNDSIFFNIASQTAFPQNLRPTMRIRVQNKNPNIQVILYVKAMDGTVHLWNLIELNTGGGNWGVAFSSVGPGSVIGNKDYGISEPALATDCITVAAHSSAYISQIGKLILGSRASFSSIGPRLGGDMKPDISAPGVSVLSSINSYTTDTYSTIASTTFNGKNYDFAKFSGTSMSCPAVAGICALIWEANPYLSPRDIKQIVIETANQDEKTGYIPPEGDVKWGHGKINALNAIRAAINFVGLEAYAPSTEDWHIYPNPATSILYVSGLDNLQDVKLIDVNGRIIQLDANKTSWNMESYNSGVYLFRVVSNNRVYQKKLILQ